MVAQHRSPDPLTIAAALPSRRNSGQMPVNRPVLPGFHNKQRHDMIALHDLEQPLSGMSETVLHPPAIARIAQTRIEAGDAQI